MDRADGVPLLAGLSGGAAVARLPRIAARVPDVLASTMAQLHRLDPGPLRARLSEGAASGDVPALLRMLSDRAGDFRRADLLAAGRWLATNPPPLEPEVICHGDLHPFNVLRSKAGAVTVLDWTAAVLGAASYDVAFTSLLLAEPPLQAPAAFRPLIGRAGRRLARRFLDRYRRYSGASVDAGSLRWHMGLVCLRALVEVAGWGDAGAVEQRGGHPWLVCGPSFARRLSSLTGAAVTPR
jgi:aminoglycoside phosphotransferase (APT) family kinase protein